MTPFCSEFWEHSPAALGCLAFGDVTCHSIPWLRHSSRNFPEEAALYIAYLELRTYSLVRPSTAARRRWILASWPRVCPRMTGIPQGSHAHQNANWNVLMGPWMLPLKHLWLGLVQGVRSSTRGGNLLDSVLSDVSSMACRALPPSG